ncbi:MAG: peptidylprolyl isomerase [Bacteriovorax sp.]|nr:peptidylprolyl isomerase [Bacteriovorax sp.]
MQVAKNKVVSIDYKLTDGSGKTIDSSENHEPLLYIQGIGNLIPGLEKELEGKKAGDHLKVTIPAKDGYGERNDSLCQSVPKSQFESTEGLEVGMQFEVETEQGELVVSVTKIEGDIVTVDGNHPLAGVELHFDVTVKEVRDASTEELAHGHVHGEGGHHH